MPHKNKAVRKRYHAKYHDDNRVKANAASKAYYAAHNTEPEERFKRFKRAARERGIEVLISYKDWLTIITNSFCHYCKGALPNKGSGIDRIDSSAGYVLENCRSCCGTCNTAKFRMTDPEFKLWIIKVYSWAVERIIEP
jgi:hypothetical protein